MPTLLPAESNDAVFGMRPESCHQAPVTVNLFVYGSLRDPAVQRGLFGRLVEGAIDALPGYRLGTVTIRDEAAIRTSGTDTHLIVSPSDDPEDRVSGLVLRLTEAELAVADAYEVEDYARIAVTLESGIEAFVYARAGEEQ
jgi:gamma-glutamylcyclotransferase (GGCT)/AIG2-like uncharacterized protein YtfP